MKERLQSDPIAHELTTRFSKQIWSPFLGALQRYRMIQPGDRVAVCMSGGKDSLLLAKCLQILKQYSKLPFEIVYLSMDPGYSPENSEKFITAAKLLGITPDIFHTDIYSIVDDVEESPCHICAAMRRGYLYKEAQKRGCNKIVLGHHRDDAAETILLSILYGGQFKAMMPRLKSENYAGMELIRPLYFVREKTVRSWLASTGITTITCACRVTRTVDGGKRARVKRLIAQLEDEQSNVVDNIIAASTSVSLTTVLSFVSHEGEQADSAMYSLPGWEADQVDRLF
jgi:tRNA 2-thiocytidine biosynthesis protein TtcA